MDERDQEIIVRALAAPRGAVLRFIVDQFNERQPVWPPAQQLLGVIERHYEHEDSIGDENLVADLNSLILRGHLRELVMAVGANSTRPESPALHAAARLLAA